MSSGYHGRRAPNVSQYLANLNTVPSSHDLANDINIQDGDLDFLTNAEFFDFDSFHPGQGQGEFNRAGQLDGEGKGQRASVNGPQYQFGEFQTYPNSVGSSPVTRGLQGHYPPQYPQAGDKRKASVANTISSPQDFEEQSRAAAEEDKRRRNTAASARFRVKKKQREAALEKQAKDMTDKVSALEGKVQQLEMENKWLKGLITDKNDGKSLETMRKEKEAEERKPDDNTDGVGTNDDDDADADADAE